MPYRLREPSNVGKASSAVSFYHFQRKGRDFCLSLSFGAGERTRTADLVLTKDALYLLSYTSILCISGLLPAK